MRKPLHSKVRENALKKKKQNGSDDGRKPKKKKVLTEENQSSAAKETQRGINAEKSQASIPENQTIVTYRDDELVFF